MEEFENFDAIFESEERLVFHKSDMKRNRSTLEDLLFVDRLLRAIGIPNPSKVYPPGTDEDLRRLHQGIIESNSPDHYKQSLIYYLLRDLKDSLGGRASDFAEIVYLPSKYKIFVDGLWWLDRLEFEKALEFLTEPVLTPTFSEDILYVLCRHAPEDDSTLPLAYYHTVSVSITSSKVLEAFFLVLCRTSVTEAFFFSRAQGELIHRGLFEHLIKFVLTDSPGSLRASQSGELVTLPLDETEESWLQDYLGEGEGKRFQGAADTLNIRAMTTGRFDALESQMEFSKDRKINGLNWAKLTDQIDQCSNSDRLAT